jgi:hypothetical protein
MIADAAKAFLKRLSCLAERLFSGSPDPLSIDAARSAL